MKQLLAVLLVVVLAVAITLFSEGNQAKVVVFFNAYRIDVSLNMALVVLFCVFLVLHGVLLVIRYSGQAPARLRDYFSSKRQSALLAANTDAFMALVLGDANTAHAAWEAAQKTKVDNDLSHLLRALFAIKMRQWDAALQSLNDLAALQEQRAKEPKNNTPQAGMMASQIGIVMQVLRARVALNQEQAEQALALLQSLPPVARDFTQTLRLTLLALQGARQWPAALQSLRQCMACMAITPAEHAQMALNIYQGLVHQEGLDANAVECMVLDAHPLELKHVPVVEVLCTALLRVGLLERARLLLEAAMQTAQGLALLPWYHAVAISNPAAAMPFVETLLANHPADLPVQELAGDVFAEGLLWGKAIACYERVYEAQASSHVARKLERIYRSCNQPDKAQAWAVRSV